MRREAQQVLAKALRSFPYSYTDIVEQVWPLTHSPAIYPSLTRLQVLPLIEKSPTVSHEQFKGALYIILQNQLLVIFWKYTYKCFFDNLYNIIRGFLR